MGLGNKRLIICCDGTWQKPNARAGAPNDDPEPTNVLKVVRGVRPKGTGMAQVVYYDAGVGTGGWFDRLAGGAFGKGISLNIQQAYRFIANNYENGDELFLFGFSRGAYTVRSLAGLIGSVGLLHKEHLQRLGDAYALYRLRPARRKMSEFHERIGDLDPQPRQSVPIKFIGVWDTVGALGAPTPLLGRMTKRWISFHDTQLGPDVEHAYQALAVDERRRPFQPDLWTGKPTGNQTIEQVWFCGVHTNVGGGYSNSGLSNITLDWIAGEAERHGLEFTTAFADGLRQASPTAAAGRLENSFTIAYQTLRLLGTRPYLREIGPHQCGDIRKCDQVVPGELVHPSASDAVGHMFRGSPHGGEYRPRNLVAALHGKGGLARYPTQKHFVPQVPQAVP